jgi:hypothetical protein
LAFVEALAEVFYLFIDVALAFVVSFLFASLVSFLTAVLASVMFEDFSAINCLVAFLVIFVDLVLLESNLARVFSSGS